VLARISIASAAVLLLASGCGGSSSDKSAASSDCGKTIEVGPGDLGGSYGGTGYPDVVGSPVVSNAGDGTACKQLLALADAYDKKKGPNLFRWLDNHGWTWMNYDDQAKPYSLFDLDKSNVFIGEKPGQRSQVAFGA
jgi:hypothetical protein